MSATRTELNKEGIWPTTDAGNAEYLAYLFQNEARYDHRRNRWLLWNEHHWQPDSEGLVYRLALGAARRRYHAAETVEDLKLRLEASKWAIQSESTMKLQSCLALAKNFEPIANDGKGWDNNTFLLGASNGVIDLKTGELRLGDREDSITMSAAIDFDPEAQCPRWERFLTEVFNDADLIDWLHRALGYSLTGDTTEQCIFMGYGIGANGKGVLCHAIHAALGDYAYTSPFSTFELYQRASIPNDLAALEHKRFVNSSETNDNTRLNEARIKAISGCDPITARYLHQEYFTFWPHLKLWLFVNHKPNVVDDSFGFWRRVRLMPFTKQFTGEADDKQLSTKLRSEAPGILAWLVKGCLEWQKRGLDPIPQSVKIATEEYKRESDVLSGFIQDRCIEHRNATAKASELYSAYKDWAEGEGLREKDKEYLNSTKFGRRMGEHYAKDRRGGTVYYYGIGLAGQLQDSFERNVAGNDVFAIETSRVEINQENYPKLSCHDEISENYPDGDYDNQALLGLTAEQVGEIWTAEGSPAIELGPGEVCHDLVMTLAGDISAEHQDAIVQWLTNTLVKAGGKQEPRANLSLICRDRAEKGGKLNARTSPERLRKALKGKGRQMIIQCPNCGEKVVVNGLGRRPLNMPVKNVCECLRKHRSVAAAANELGCSQGYIFKVLKANGLNLKDILKGG